MIPLFTTLARSLTGKVALGLAVATLGVGAVAAAGAELPTLTPVDAADESGEPSDEMLDEGGDGQTGDATNNERSDAATPDETEEQEDAPAGDEATPVDESEDGPDPTHGAVVSEFTQGTDLHGCEKGQATAAVARGDVDPSSPTLDEDLAPYIATCGDTGEKPDDAEAEDAADDEDADEAEWKDLRDDAKAEWHEAKDAYVAACGDDDTEDDDDGDDERSPECDELQAEVEQLHRDGKADWKAARDAEHAERKAERAAAKNSGTSNGRSGKG